MRKKIVTTLLFASTLLNSQELNNEKFQLVAKNIDSKENVVTANGDVVIFSPTYYLSANKVIYDKEKETFNLYGNVLVIKDNNVQTQSDYAFMDLKNELSAQNPTFLYEKNNNIWVNSAYSTKEKNIVNLDSSIISSCDCLDPVWTIRASSAEYDTEAKWLNAYNPRLYVKDVPVFYSPYLGFPTDKTRRTGLLIPTIGYSKTEGIYYSQPIYFAPAQNYDLEVVPQIRTRRGEGAYAYYRYADSPDSMLKIKAGFFQEQKNYQEKNLLDNSLHYGGDLNYQRRNIFSNQLNDDGLFTSLKYLNDVEYITLEHDDIPISTDKKVESKINYFYNTPEYYTGTYLRYYINSDPKISNKTTLQELPQLQFHSYNKNIFTDKLIYNIDSKFMNYTRPEGLNARIYEISAPISYTQYFADDYFYVNLENKTIVTKYDYDNFSTINYKDANLIQNRTSVSIGTDLIKPYDDYLHTVNLNAEYAAPKNLKKDGDLYGITVDKNSTKGAELKAFPIAQEEKNINLSLNQSLYNKDNLNQFINHKMSQSILYDEMDNPQLQNYENYVKINHDFGNITAKAVYNMQDHELIEDSESNTLKYDKASFSVGHYKSKQTLNSNKENLESYRVGAAYDISKDYKVSYYENYNILEKLRNKQGVSFNINDNCWNLDLRLEKEILPTSSINPDGVNQRIVYVNLLLKPVGGIKQKYKMTNSSN